MIATNYMDFSFSSSFCHRGVISLKRPKIQRRLTSFSPVSFSSPALAGHRSTWVSKACRAEWPTGSRPCPTVAPPGAGRLPPLVPRPYPRVPAAPFPAAASPFPSGPQRPAVRRSVRDAAEDRWSTPEWSPPALCHSQIGA